MVKGDMGGCICRKEREEKETIRIRNPENANVAYRDSGNRIYDLE